MKWRPCRLPWTCVRLSVRVFVHVCACVCVLPTSDPLHPGGVVDAQVVVEDLEDVAQDDAEVL